MTKLLFVDDEPFFVQNYLTKLKDAGYEVTFSERADEGLRYLLEKPTEFKIVALDFMMPTPPGVAPRETDDGLEAGRWFIRSARDILEENKIGVLVLTNRAVEGVKKILEQDLLVNMTHITVHHKSQTPAFHFPMIVRDMLNKIAGSQ
jgi:CheY-like chemotaxis protein